MVTYDYVAQRNLLQLVAHVVSLSLLRTFYAEGLVDNRTFLSWLVQQMATCNRAQLGLVARLADEYLEGMLVSRALTHPFTEACLGKFMEVCYSSSPTVHINRLTSCDRRSRARTPSNT